MKQISVVAGCHSSVVRALVAIVIIIIIIIVVVIIIVCVSRPDLHGFEQQPSIDQYDQQPQAPHYNMNHPNYGDNVLQVGVCVCVCV